MNELPRCGRISYTNDLPVYTAIDDGVLPFPGTMISDVPALLNQALLDGQLDISPISSALYAGHAGSLSLLPNICIGAKEKVHSICLISTLGLEKLAGQKIAVTRESLTGLTMLKVICRVWCGFDPHLVSSDDPFADYLEADTPCLLIGDKAIDAAQAVPNESVHDMGELWHRYTGTGMVYSVWAVRDDYMRQAPMQARSVAAALEGSLEWGLENMRYVIARAQTIRPRADGFYGDYYRSLNFRLDRPAREALEKFFAIAADAGVLSAPPTFRFFDEVPQHA
jgi:chorismate dehydratase